MVSHLDGDRRLARHTKSTNNSNINGTIVLSIDRHNGEYQAQNFQIDMG
jgi:hypothetical protein